MSGKSIPTKQVIIIGAGLSGLYAAKTLADHHVPILVLEAQNRVGGRSLTQQTPIDSGGTANVDQGAGYVGSTQSMVQELCKSLKIDTHEVPGKFFGSKYNFTFSLGGKVLHSKCPLDDLFTFLSPVEFFAMAITMIKTWSLGRTIPYESPWTSPNAKKWDAMTFENWLDQCFPSWGGHFKNAKTMFQFVSRTPLGIEPSETSLLYFLWYIRSADNLFSLLFFAQDKIVVGGTQQISENLQKTLPSNSLKLSHPATHIAHGDGGVTVQANSLPFVGDRVILAITPHVRSRLLYDPLVSPMHNQLCQRSPMGTTIKIHLFYSDRIWMKDGYNGNCSIFDGNSVCQVYDVTEPGSVNYCLQGFYVGDVGRRAAQESADWRKKNVISELMRVLGGNDAYRTPIGYSEYIWDNHAYVGGAPVGTCSTGTLTSFGKALRGRTGSERIHYAGTETSTQWAGYMEGALRAGQRAAYELLDEYDVKHDQIAEPDNSLTQEALEILHKFLKYAADAANKMPKVASMVMDIDRNEATNFLIKKEGFDNTNDWLVRYLDENPEVAVSLEAGIRELNSFKDQLLVA